MSIYQRLQKHTQQKQSGVALITMLMIFAIVTVMTADTTERMGLDIRKTRFYIHNAQATEYALGAESFARQVLFDDFESDSEGVANDHLAETWNKVVIPIEFDHGSVRIVIRDLQARYNINNLIAEDGKTNPEALARFNVLLQNISLSSNQDGNLGNNIADWLDSDTTPTGYYSEDTSYLNNTPGYRSANQTISDTSELLAIAKIDFKTYSELAPFVTALPTQTAVNINTAPLEVLATIDDKLDAEKVITARELLPEGFASSQEFLEAEVSAGAELGEGMFTVQSEYFEVWIEASFQEHKTYLRSVFHRDTTDGRLALLGRTFKRPLDSAQDNPFIQPVATSDDDEGMLDDFDEQPELNPNSQNQESL